MGSHLHGDGQKSVVVAVEVGLHQRLELARACHQAPVECERERHAVVPLRHATTAPDTCRESLPLDMRPSPLQPRWKYRTRQNRRRGPESRYRRTRGPCRGRARPGRKRRKCLKGTGVHRVRGLGVPATLCVTVPLCGYAPRPPERGCRCYMACGHIRQSSSCSGQSLSLPLHRKQSTGRSLPRST